MKTIIISSGKFHIPSIIDDLITVGYKNIIVLSGSPRFDNRVKHIWIPLIGQILFRKILKIKQPSWSKYLDFIWIDLVAWLFVTNKSRVIGFAGVSLFSGLKAKRLGGEYILDRACPWLPKQIEINRIESKINNIAWSNISNTLIRRCESEYIASDIIKVPSKFSGDSFPEYLKNKVSEYTINVKSIPLQIKKESEKKIISIGFIGTNYTRKGTRILIEAIRKILMNHKQIILKIKMDKHIFLSSDISRQFLSDFNEYISFQGYFKNIGDFYADIDILLVPSLDEGFGMVVFEALQAGTPVISSTNVGASQYLVKSEFSKTFLSGDSSELEKCINQLIHQISKGEKKCIQDDCMRTFNKYLEQKINYV